MLLMGLVALLLIAPMVVPMIYGKFFSTNYDVYGHDPLVYSADLESFFVPGIYSLYAQNTASLWTHWTGYWESANYMGYVLLAVVAITLLLVRKREVWFWTIIAAVFGVLSLGPYLHIGGVAHRSVPLPYILLMKLPLFSLGGVAMRFYSMSLVALIILTGMGLAHIQKHWRRGYLIAPLLFVLMIAELYPAPVDSSAVIVPKFYTTLAQDTAVYNIMDFSQDPPKVLYYQTVHHKPLIGGYTSRPTLASQRFLDTTPVLSDLYSDDYKYQRTSPPADGKAILKSLNIKYVLVPAYHRSLRAYLGKMHLQVVSKDIEMMVYRVY